MIRAGVNECHHSPGVRGCFGRGWRYRRGRGGGGDGDHGGGGDGGGDGGGGGGGVTPSGHL